MPELPEVESIRRSLIPLIEGKTISRLDIHHPDVFLNPGNYQIIGRKITGLTREGKYLRILLDDQSYLLVHLRMTGKLLYHPDLVELIPHTHLRFSLVDQAGEVSYLDYNDIRRFGRVGLYRNTSEIAAPGYLSLGPDALSPDFTPDYLYTQAKRYPKRPIKSLILDQKVVAGLGNIYADEALFRAGILPQKSSGKISKADIFKLHAQIGPLLEESIGLKGTSFSDYVDGLGKKGSFINQLAVYGRKGQACKKCGQTLDSDKLAGRTTVFCRNCQR